MRELELPPEPQLLESMRAVGYTLETSIADLVDNSLSAGARSIEILFEHSQSTYVAVLDDGHGMDEARAIRAMQLAGTGGMPHRGKDDLGRFGLGLKTASLAQCRRFTVISKALGSELVAFCWDLDRLQSSGRWTLQQLSMTDIADLPRVQALQELPHGTLVLWEHLDQLAAVHGNTSQALDTAMMAVRDHLALVFHRFLERPEPGRVRMAINYAPIEPADPFLKTHRLTIPSPEETLQVDGQKIRFTAYTLPHLNHLTRKEIRKAQIGTSLRDSQGFYVYRSNRLVIWGTWFRTQKRSEVSKLARVQVDIPNTLDHEWSLDIKKSRAMPPPLVMVRLRSLAKRFSEPSQRTTQYRGRPVADAAPEARLWLLVEDREGFRYAINEHHPLILTHTAYPSSLPLREVLRAVETTAPFTDAHLRLCRDEQSAAGSMPNAEMVAMAADLWAALKSSLTPDEFVTRFAAVEPFLGEFDARTILEGATNAE